MSTRRRIGSEVATWRTAVQELQSVTTTDQLAPRLAELCAVTDLIVKRIDRCDRRDLATPLVEYKELLLTYYSLPANCSDRPGQGKLTHAFRLAQAAISRIETMDLSMFEDYMPAKDCRNDRIVTHKQLKSLLEKEKGIRHVSQGQHLFVHAGDWYKWNAEQERRRSERLDLDEVADGFAGTAAKIRAENLAGIA